MMNLAQVLSNNFVFRGVSVAALNALAAVADVREYRGGDTIVRQFDTSKDLIILLEGTARIKAFGGETIAEFGPGSILGEMAMVDDQPRSATVVSVGTSRACIIPASFLHSVLEADPEAGRVFYRNLAKVLARKLRSMNAKADGDRSFALR